MKSFVEIKVRNYHLDQFKHVNNARYLEFLEEGRWSYSEKNNLIDVFEKNGIGHVAVNITINFRKSARAGDMLLVETDVKQRSKKSVTMKQKIFLKSSGDLIADATVTNVFLDAKTKAVIPTEELSGYWGALSGLADSPDID